MHAIIVAILLMLFHQSQPPPTICASSIDFDGNIDGPVCIWRLSVAGISHD